MVQLKNGRRLVGWNVMKEGVYDTKWGQKGRQGPDHTSSFYVILRILVIILRTLRSYWKLRLFKFLKFISQKNTRTCSISNSVKGYNEQTDLSLQSLSNLVSPPQGSHANLTFLPKILCMYIHKHYILFSPTQIVAYYTHTLYFSFSACLYCISCHIRPI